MPFVPGFLPSTHAPLFRNGPWPAGLRLTIRVVGIPVLSLDATRWGLCGGMTFLTRDSIEAGQPQLCARDSTGIPLALAQHLLRRQIDSVKARSMIARWLTAIWQPDHGTGSWGRSLAQVTVAECSAIMQEIDAGRLCPIGLVAARRWVPWEIFKNHVVLVWGYERAGDRLTLYTYDSNFPGRDDIILRLDLSSSGAGTQITTNGTDGPAAGCIRGLFRVLVSGYVVNKCRQSIDFMRTDHRDTRSTCRMPSKIRTTGQIQLVSQLFALPSERHSQLRPLRPIMVL